MSEWMNWMKWSQFVFLIDFTLSEAKGFTCFVYTLMPMFATVVVVYYVVVYYVDWLNE